MIDLATRTGIARRLDERLRRSYIFDNHGLTMPATHGHDELLPFWTKGRERPDDERSLKRSRGRPKGGPDALFVPRDIPGTPGGPLGCGYMGFRVESAGAPSTALPGSIGRQESEPITLELWIYTPASRDDEIGDHYTSVLREIWDASTMGREYFEDGSPPGEGVLWIDQLGLIPTARDHGQTALYKKRLMKIPLSRRSSVVRIN